MSTSRQEGQAPAPAQDRRGALFLDRDGVIIAEVNYLGNPDDLVLIPGAAETIAAFNAASVPVVIVTNQAGIGRGLYTEADYHAVQAKLYEELARRGAHVHATYFCPHHPTHGRGAYRVVCPCRKPAPGMLTAAANDLDIDLTASVLVGDKISDLEAARTAGCGAVLVATGHGSDHRDTLSRSGKTALYDAFFASLHAAKPYLHQQLACGVAQP